VVESRLVKDKRTKRFRGFAFVTFHEYKAVDKVLKEEHTIMGKKVDLKKAFTKEQTRDKLLDEKQRKVYITGIPKKLDRKTIAKYFSKFGKVADVRIIHDQNKSSKHKGFGFVLFARGDSLGKVLKSGHSHKVGGVILDCR
jgi:RNA recognition motif-containing protein